MSLRICNSISWARYVRFYGVWLAIQCIAEVSNAYIERPQYAVIDIGSLGREFVTAYDVNNAGVVTGASFLPAEDYHALLWRNGHMYDIHTMGDDSMGFGINDLCQVVGRFDPPDAFERAFLWENGVMYDLGTLGGSDSTANAINDAGVVVGDSYMYGDEYFHAFLWKNGVMIDLGALETDWGSQAWNINSSGQVVGWSTYFDGEYYYKRAVLWTGPYEIDNLGTFGDGDSKAYGINDWGQIVGYSDEPILLGEPHAFIWENGVMYDIHEDYGDADSSYAHSINNLTQVVGTWGHPVRDPFIWTQQTGMVSLMKLIPPKAQWNLDTVYSINDLGQMVGDGRRHGGDWNEPHGYIATPVYPSFDLSKISPGIAGVVNTVQAFNVEPGTKVYFVWGRYGGGELIPGCDVTINALQIENPKVAGSAVADENGVAMLEGLIPPGASGATLLLQAVVPGDCAISNLVVQDFE